MYKYAPGDWHSCVDKRALSLLDKNTLPSRELHAMIMPGEPGTEFEELLDVGYPLDLIECVDNTRDDYHLDILQQYYGDSFYNNDVFDHMKNTTRTYSYVHFDMCCMSDGDTSRNLLPSMSKLAPLSRFRYSGSRTIRGTTAKEKMEAVLEGYSRLKSYCLNMSKLSTSPFWEEAAGRCNDATDEAGGILAFIYTEMPDIMLPSNVYKKVYLGKHSSSHMFTFWIDFDPKVKYSQTHEAYIINQILGDSQKWREQ